MNQTVFSHEVRLITTVHFQRDVIAAMQSRVYRVDARVRC